MIQMGQAHEQQSVTTALPPHKVQLPPHTEDCLVEKRINSNRTKRFPKMTLWKISKPRVGWAGKTNSHKGSWMVVDLTPFQKRHAAELLLFDAVLGDGK